MYSPFCCAAPKCVHNAIAICNSGLGTSNVSMNHLKDILNTMMSSYENAIACSCDKKISFEMCIMKSFDDRKMSSECIHDRINCWFPRKCEKKPKKRTIKELQREKFLEKLLNYWNGEREFLVMVGEFVKSVDSLDKAQGVIDELKMVVDGKKELTKKMLDDSLWFFDIFMNDLDTKRDEILEKDEELHALINDILNGTPSYKLD